MSWCLSGTLMRKQLQSKTGWPFSPLKERKAGIMPEGSWKRCLRPRTYWANHGKLHRLWGEEMLDEYKPSHNENRLSHEGDIRFARKDYYSRGPGNLKFLLKNRYEWMNRFINKGDFALEVGCG